MDSVRLLALVSALSNHCLSKGRNILDGPLILNEVIAWFRKRKNTIMVFKVDFEKAFDSLRWDYLDMVMEKLGFGLKDLRQGYPLSPFLFILATKGLHMLTCKVEESGEWSWLNAHNHLCMLRCFYLISSLKINVNKSNLRGVYVPDETVSNMAYSIGCGAASFPIKYLGVPVGCNMARRHPRCGAKMVQFTYLQAKIENTVLLDQGDTWHWALDSSSFFVASAQSLIDSITLDTTLIATFFLYAGSKNINLLYSRKVNANIISLSPNDPVNVQITTLKQTLAVLLKSTKSHHENVVEVLQVLRVFKVIVMNGTLTQMEVTTSVKSASNKKTVESKKPPLDADLDPTK
nr:hypothetical protein [Tanacetum cinerariifolium]